MKTILILATLSLSLTQFAWAAENSDAGATLGNVDCTLAKQAKKLPEQVGETSKPKGGKSSSASAR